MSTDSKMLGRGTAVISEQVLCPLFKSAKAGWDPLYNQVYSTPVVRCPPCEAYTARGRHTGQKMENRGIKIPKCIARQKVNSSSR